MLGSVIQRTEVIVRVPVSAWTDATTFCRKRLGMEYFCFLSGLDWLDSPVQTSRYENVWGAVEDADSADAVPLAPVAAPAATPIKSGLAGGDSRFQVFARVYSIRDHRGIVLKADLNDADPRVPSIWRTYAGANWHERETWEMYGFWFDGHPGLTHIYLPGSFEGYPLRKDFPLLAREVKPWPGLTNVEPIAGEADEEGTDA